MRHVRWMAAFGFIALACAAQAQNSSPAPGNGQAPAGTPVKNIKEVCERLGQCWKPPPAAAGVNPMDITVIVSFNRSGVILGHPRITYESAQATDRDRLAYRVAVMETLQRCTPMPFTE